MDVLPKELVAWLLHYLNLKRRFRLSLADQRHRELAWVGAYECIHTRKRDYKMLYALIDQAKGMADPQVCLGLRSMDLSFVRKPLPVIEEVEQFLSRCHALHTVKIAVQAGDMGLVVSALSQAASPLRKLVLETSGTDMYRGIEADMFAPWAKTLFKLVLISKDDQLEPPIVVMDGIARHLGSTLKVLGLSTRALRPPRPSPALLTFLQASWVQLKTLTALEVLYIHAEGALKFIDCDNLEYSIALQRSANPPCIGISLIVGYDGELKSLLTVAAQDQQQLSKVGAILAAGFNPNTQIAVLDNFDLAHSHIPFLLEENAPIDVVVQVLATGRVELFGKYDSHRCSLFKMVLSVASGVPFEDWRKLAEAVFESNIWTDALKVHKRSDLLPTKQAQFFELFTNSDLHLRLQYCREHPEIFGPLDVHSKLDSGCTLLHMANYPATVFYLLDIFKLDWRVTDNDGHNTIECQAQSINSSALAALMLRIPDEDFIRYCTPYIWANLGGWSPSHKSTTKACVERLVGLLPNAKDVWRGCITAFAQVHLRTGGALALSEVAQYEGPECQVIHHLLVDGLMVANYDLNPWKAQFKRARTNKEELTQPLPHLVSEDYSSTPVVRLLTDALKKRMTQQEFEAWVGQTDSQGRSWEVYLLERRTKYRVAEVKPFFTWSDRLHPENQH